ncbi:hypothetical protein BsWGS_13644 [Bradybaena similaris]
MDKNGFLDALTAYSRNPCPEIPAILEQYLNGIASNGETLFHWPLLKPLLFAKLEQVIGELQKELSSEVIPERPNVENVPFDVMHERIVEAFHKFNGAPFTIQRLCELLIDPKRHYKRSDKFLRGLEKNVLVVSTVDPFGRNVVSEASHKHLVNGLDTVGSPFFPRDSSITSNLPPVPGWVTSAPSVTSPHSIVPADVSSLKQSQPSSQDSAVTTSVVGSVVTSLYGEQPQASQTEEVVEETVVTMDTSESAVVPDGRETGSEEENIGMEDSNTSSSSSSSEELSTNDMSDSSSSGPGDSSPSVSGDGSCSVAAVIADTDTSQTSPWVSVATEGENKVHVTSSDPVSDDHCADVTDADSSSRSDKSAAEVLPSHPASDEQADSFLSCSGEVHSSSSSSESESAEKSGLSVDASSSEMPMETSSEQQDSYNDSTGFDTAFTPEGEMSTLDPAGACCGSEDLSGVSSEATSMDTAPPATETTASQTTHSSQTVDSSSCSDEAASSDVSSQSATSPAAKDEHSCTTSLENPDCSLDSSPSSPPTQPVDLSSTLHSSASRSSHLHPLSPDSSSESPEPQAKRRKISHESSHVLMSSNASTEVSISPDVQVSSNTPSDVYVASELQASESVPSDVSISADLQVSESAPDDNSVSPDLPISTSLQDDVSILSGLQGSVSTSDNDTISSESDPVSTTKSNVASDFNYLAEPVCDENSDISDIHDGPAGADPVCDENSDISDIHDGSTGIEPVCDQNSDISDIHNGSAGAVPVCDQNNAILDIHDGPASSEPVCDQNNDISNIHDGPASSEPVCDQNNDVSDIHDGSASAEPAVHAEVHENVSEGRECVASPPSQEASSSDSQGFDTTVESQHTLDTEATTVGESARLEEFEHVEDVKKVEEPSKEEDTTESNSMDPQN